MATTNVNISFEAASADDARAKIEKWKLHEGCTVMMSLTEVSAPHETNKAGAVVETPPPPEIEPLTVETSG